MAHRRQRTVNGLLHGPLRSAARSFGRERQHLLRVDRPDKRCAQGTKREATKCRHSTVGLTVVFVVHNPFVLPLRLHGCIARLCAVWIAPLCPISTGSKIYVAFDERASQVGVIGKPPETKSVRSQRQLTGASPLTLCAHVRLLSVAGGFRGVLQTLQRVA